MNLERHFSAGCDERRASTGILQLAALSGGPRTVFFKLAVMNEEPRTTKHCRGTPKHGAVPGSGSKGPMKPTGDVQHPGQGQRHEGVRRGGLCHRSTASTRPYSLVSCYVRRCQHRARDSLAPLSDSAALVARTSLLPLRTNRPWRILWSL